MKQDLGGGGSSELKSHQPGPQTETPSKKKKEKERKKEREKERKEMLLIIDFVSYNFTKFISSNSFMVKSLGFPIQDYMIFQYKITSANKDNLTSFFSNLDTFYFSYLIALGRTSSTMLNNSSENG